MDRAEAGAEQVINLIKSYVLTFALLAARAYRTNVLYTAIPGGEHSRVMKKLLYQGCVLMIAALACANFSGCQTSNTASSAGAATAAPNQDGGRLIIHRAANLGQGLLVSIDGVKNPPVREGETYTGTLAPGQHVVSVILYPNRLNLPPTVKTLTIEKGKTYAFTAIWQGDTLVLR